MLARVGGLAAGLLLLGVWAQPASAQLVGSDVESNAQASWNTASAGVMGLRAPGRVVNQARADFRERHGASIGRSLAGPTITEEPVDPTPAEALRAEVLQTLFDQLNTFLAAFGQVIGAGSTSTDTGDSTGYTSTSTTPASNAVTGDPSSLLGVIRQ